MKETESHLADRQFSGDWRTPIAGSTTVDDLLPDIQHIFYMESKKQCYSVTIHHNSSVILTEVCFDVFVYFKHFVTCRTMK